MLKSRYSKEKFSATLRMLRAQRGIKIEEVADQLGLHREAYSNWERGKAFPQPRNLEKLAGFYGVSVDDLLADKTTSLGSPGKKVDTPSADQGKLMENILGGLSMEQFLRIVLDQIEGRFKNIEARVELLEGDRTKKAVKTLEDLVRDAIDETQKPGNHS